MDFIDDGDAGVDVAPVLLTLPIDASVDPVPPLPYVLPSDAASSLLGSNPPLLAVPYARSESNALTTNDAPARWRRPIRPNMRTRADTDPAARVEPIEPNPAMGANALDPSSGVNTDPMNAQC